MARLQDFNSVTPATSDNLLIVQSQGQGLSTLNAVGQKVATETTMSSLSTTAKTLVGAISENADYIKYLLRTEQTDLNSSLNGGTVSPRITYYPSTATNRPSENSGVVITQGNGTYRQQLAIDLEGNIYVRYYNNGTISNWTNKVENVNARLVNARLTWNGSYFTIPSSKARPYSNQQITVLGRNLYNGAVYAVWYDSSVDGFRMSATLVGNAPSTNNTIDVQYMA